MDTKTAKEIVSKLFDREVLTEEERMAISLLVYYTNTSSFKKNDNSFYLPDHLIRK